MLDRVASSSSIHQDGIGGIRGPESAGAGVVRSVPMLPVSCRRTDRSWFSRASLRSAVLTTT